MTRDVGSIRDQTRSFLCGSSSFHSNQCLFLEFTVGETDMTCFALICMLLMSLPEGFILVTGGPSRDLCGHHFQVDLSRTRRPYILRVLAQRLSLG